MSSIKKKTKFHVTLNHHVQVVHIFDDVQVKLSVVLSYNGIHLLPEPLLHVRIAG